MPRDVIVVILFQPTHVLRGSGVATSAAEKLPMNVVQKSNSSAGCCVVLGK
jgi:quinol monooxygenase YgiN